jgi:uncharacterized membrane protein
VLSHLQWNLRRLTRQIWLRATAFSVLGVATALLAVWLQRYIPDSLPATIGANAVDSLLKVLAASMLSVTIFSLSTMVAAFGSATGNVTPRATRLLTGDSRAQNALATFLGSFLYSLVGLIVLKTGLYGEKGRVVLFAVTLLVVVLIVFTLLRWISYALRLGQVGVTSKHVEEVAIDAMRAYSRAPYMGGVPDDRGEWPQHPAPVYAGTLGYVEHIDMGRLQEVAERRASMVRVLALPGTYVGSTRPLAEVAGGCDAQAIEDLRDAFSVGDARSFDQDPRFGLCVLAEIASRALSPAVNDPGTAIDVLGRGARVLAIAARMRKDEKAQAICPRVHVPAIAVEEMFDDLFVPVARDGAPLVEVCIHLQKVLAMLAHLGDDTFSRAARHQSRQALERAEQALSLALDIERVRRAAAKVDADHDSQH